MYAVFRSGGKQYRASEGDRLKLEKIDAEAGANVEFDQVLLVGQGSDVKVGTPLLAGSVVKAKVLAQGKSRKVPVVKFRRRQNYLRQGSHRQFFTEVEITGIAAGKTAKTAEAAPAEAAAPKPAAKKATAKKATAKKATAKKATAKKAAKKKAVKKDAE
jgi:large subunit ribosomal protein L21